MPRPVPSICSAEAPGAVTGDPSRAVAQLAIRSTVALTSWATALDGSPVTAPGASALHIEGTGRGIGPRCALFYRITPGTVTHELRCAFDHPSKCRQPGLVWSLRFGLVSAQNFSVVDDDWGKR